ncbi:type II toxin-antitoxin system RelE/ParE family toxin [Myxococcota bacterium]|nr:type II toxin-antitoxin system RelE/ParE family toxin [Myxococcota bacterium]
MDGYAIEYTSRALRDLKELDMPIRARVFRAIEALRADPHPPASKRLKGSETFRLRVGDYRVIYEVSEDFTLRVLVLTVGHRREVYR